MIWTCSTLSSKRSITRQTTDITLFTLIAIIVLIILTSPIWIVKRHSSMFNRSFPFFKILNTNSIVVNVYCPVACWTIFNAFAIICSKSSDVTCLAISRSINTMMTDLVTNLTLCCCYCRIVVNVPVSNITGTKSSSS